MADLIERQAAIDIFHAFAPGIPWDTLEKIFNEIPSAQPETSTDCISRQAAIDSIRKEYGGIKNANMDGDFLADELEFILSKVPSAQPERKKGRWIKTGQSFVFPEKFRNYSCSECGYDVDKTKLNYCPNCGAEMRGEQDE